MNKHANKLPVFGKPKIAKQWTTALLFSTLATFVVPAFAHEAIPAPSTINVSGTGKAAVAPDLAILQLGVVRNGKTAREALTKNNKAMANVVETMKNEGIAERDLQTSGFNIQPQYIYPRHKNNEEPKPPKLIGYQVMNNLTVRIRDLTKTGTVLDKVVTLGVNSGGNVTFTTDDPTDALRQARKRAMAEAIDKAKTLTEASGVSLGKILSISENSNRPQPFNIRHKAARMEAPVASDAVPVQAGENEYRVNVNVSWEINQ